MLVANCWPVANLISFNNAVALVSASVTDAATLDELANLASTIGCIVFVVYVCMTAVNLFLATAESVRDYFKNFLTIPKLTKLPIVGIALPDPLPTVWSTLTGPIQTYVLDPVKNYKHRTILPFEGSHGSTLSGTIATITAATSEIGRAHV